MISASELQTEVRVQERMVTLPPAAEALLDKIEKRQAVVAVIGLGYVGLPLAVAFAETGFRVVGIDIDKRRVSSLNAGESYISDVPKERLAELIAPLTTVIGRTPINGKNGGSKNGNGHRKSTGSLSATMDFSILSDVDAVIICVPTPLSHTKDPDMSFIVSAVDEIAQRLHPGMLVSLESTTYPGTTEEVLLPRLEQGQGSNGNGHGTVGNGRSSFVVGRDFFLAFSPERIDPGRTDFTVETTPKVIGGVTPWCLEVTRALYGTAVKTVVPVSLPKTAEMVKLLENTFRAVNIGLINEVAIMCDRLGINVWEVIDAAKTKPYGFMSFYPGPGLGGHCIPIDPQYLAWKLKTLNYNARFIQIAAEVNFGMPEYVLEKVADALNEDSKALKGSRVLVLGVAYKENVGDMRESPALDVVHLLREKGALVSYHDPYVPKMTVDQFVMESVPLNAEAVQAADCVVITTAHSSYDWNWVVENSRLVVDTRNATRNVRAPSTRIVTL